MVKDRKPANDNDFHFYSVKGFCHWIFNIEEHCIRFYGMMKSDPDLAVTL